MVHDGTCWVMEMYVCVYIYMYIYTHLHEYLHISSSAANGFGFLAPKVSTPSWAGDFVTHLCSPLWMGEICSVQLGNDKLINLDFYKIDGSAQTACYLALAISNERGTERFWKRMNYPSFSHHAALEKRSDAQGVSTSWRVRLCYLPEKLQLISSSHLSIPPILLGSCILFAND